MFRVASLSFRLAALAIPLLMPLIQSGLTEPFVIQGMSSRLSSVAPPAPVDSMWQPIAIVDIQALTGDAQIQAATCVGTPGIGPYVYVAGGRNPSSITDNVIYRFNLDWTLNATYPQPQGSGHGYCDLCWDGTYLYGLTSYYIFAFDLNGNLIPALNIPLPPTMDSDRGVAYDPATDHFWVGNGGQPGLMELDRAGNIISSDFLGTNGMAWDNLDPEGPWLWIFHNEGAIILQKYDPQLYALVSVQPFTLPGVSLLNACGCEVTTFYDPSYSTLIGVCDGGPSNHDVLYVLEMYPAYNPYVPAAPYSFNVANNGAVLQASLSWTNPTITAGGLPLTTITSIHVARDSSLIAMLYGTPGQNMTYQDPVPDTGLYNYQVYCLNDSGEGLHASQNAWISLDVPGAPTDVLAIGNGLNAELTWTAPTVGAHGGYWPAGSWDGQKIYRDGMLLTTLLGTNTYYLDLVSVAGIYTYGVAYFNVVGEGPTSDAPPVALSNVDLVINGKFETGTFPPWISHGWEITTPGHTGRYCAWAPEAYSIDLLQYFAPTPAQDILAATLWMKTNDDDLYAWVKFYYTNGQVVDHLMYSGLAYQWYLHDVTGLINPDWMLNGIGFGAPGLAPYGIVWIDDVSILVNDAPPEVTIILTPWQPPPPLIIPASGGSFSYTIALANNETGPVVCGAWTMVLAPNGYWWGPILGPINNITMPGGGSLTRLRNQLVPGWAPAGNYLYYGYVGNYPAKWDSSGFEFTKLDSTGLSLGSGEWSPMAGGWDNTGESFGEANAGTQYALSVPSNFTVSINPNPFNPTTTIRFVLPQAAKVNLTVYDLSGRVVATLVNGWREVGSYDVTFDGSNLASGIYFYRLSAGDFNTSGKLVMMK